MMQQIDDIVHVGDFGDENDPTIWFIYRNLEVHIWARAVAWRNTVRPKIEYTVTIYANQQRARGHIAQKVYNAQSLYNVVLPVVPTYRLGQLIQEVRDDIDNWYACGRAVPMLRATPKPILTLTPIPNQWKLEYEKFRFLITRQEGKFEWIVSFPDYPEKRAAEHRHVVETVTQQRTNHKDEYIVTTNHVPGVDDVVVQLADLFIAEIRRMTGENVYPGKDETGAFRHGPNYN